MLYQPEVAFWWDISFLGKTPSPKNHGDKNSRDENPQILNIPNIRDGNPQI